MSTVELLPLSKVMGDDSFKTPLNVIVESIAGDFVDSIDVDEVVREWVEKMNDCAPEGCSVIGNAAIVSCNPYFVPTVELDEWAEEINQIDLMQIIQNYDKDIDA